MKIITDNSVYVQIDDIEDLYILGVDAPSSIFMKVYDNGFNIADDSEKYAFVEFNEPDEIEFFRSADWIIDYNEVKDLSEEEIELIYRSIVEERKNISQKFNSMSFEEQKENPDMMFRRVLLGYKLYSMGDVLNFKKGNLKMKLPECVDLPTGFVQEKGIRKLARTIFNKREN